ncbi:retropepsin-like aspartic protease family protein [Ottowia sp. SB7-C50]|uniref:retropepsin-like aspartic protease family protein n=1 Tax=Ottowia sp. SB7-C50 TaxID=3081231 RepID=UPI002954732B|nr:TIGR02281 family clan AA aspartic protease [Ottowia sp. SB7-C50]WOP16850.1 TIGR02281 family clan AA aspartic protease [Ottowia sp. SB7-C50]
MRLHASLIAAGLAALSLGAAAQTVALQGMLGSKALLMVGGGAPRAVAPGETLQGVKVLSTSGDQAVVLVAGQRVTLRVGEAPASVGAAAPAGGDRISLTADGRGHFITQGSINQRPVQFMVDTGASVVAIGQSEADRLGLNYKAGRAVTMHTANGAAPGWLFKIATLRVGDVNTYDVDAVVTPGAMPSILLGNSFLNRFSMRREGDQMLLIKR